MQSLKNSSVPFQNSSLYHALKLNSETGQPLRLAFMDIDASWTGTPEEQVALRQELEKQGYIIAFVTARTSELCMSWGQRDKSSAIVNNRPTAKLVRNPQTGTRTVIDPAALPSMAGLLDPDIIAASSGAELLVHQRSGGYEYDEEYADSFTFDSDQWRNYAVQLLRTIEVTAGKSVGALHKIENVENYYAGKTDITPPLNRVQITFESRDARNLFISTLKALQKNPPANSNPNFQAMLAASHVIDESNPYAPRPRFALYLVPAGLSKAVPVNRVMAATAQLLAISPEKFETLFTGDSPPDLAMGLATAAGTQATFVIVGGARLARYIKENKTEFLEPEFQDIQKNLEPTGTTGHYIYKPTNRNVIIGDEAFPGTIGPQTTLAWLKNSLAK